MLAFIKGEVSWIGEDYVIIDSNNIGYEITVPQSVMVDIPAIGHIIKLHTYMYIREDAINLYGFLTRQDLEVFKLLISVSGIGPKGACAVLSIMSVEELTYAICMEDAKSIAKAQGVGLKTAQKVVIDLKSKLKIDTLPLPLTPLGPSQAVTNELEAIQALVALGYSSTEARQAVKSVDTALPTEELIKSALRKLI